MAIFLGVHALPFGTTEAQAAESFAKYKESAQANGLTALSAVYSVEKGLAYCQTEAETAEQVVKAHDDVQVPVEDVIEVKTLD